MLSSDWQCHEDQTVDLAVLPWGMIKNNFTCASLNYDGVVKKRSFFETNGGSWPPGVGEPLVFIGMMSQVAGISRNYPIVRRGHLALVTAEKITREYGPSEYYIADLQTYPGHSGGPVWVAFGETLFLLCVMVAGYEQPLIEAGKKCKVDKYNLGVSLVTLVEKLTDIIFSDALVEHRQRETSRPVKPIPTA